MIIDDHQTAEWWLEQWGQWARVGAHPRHSYPSITPVERLRAKTPGGHAITDAQGAEIDALITVMRNRYPAMAEAVYRYYKGGASYRQVAREMRTNTRAVSDHINGGKQWIDAAMVFSQFSIAGVATRML